MDAYDLAYLRNNVEVLAKEGFTDKPEDLIKEARRVAQQALEDPEGRINPEGNYENELVTAVFGQPESAQFIKNPKLRALLDPEQGPPKLKHSIRSYDVDALAGLVPTGKSGIAFDWFNIKNNYSPFDDKLFIPKPEADVQITEKLFMPASEAGAGKRRFPRRAICSPLTISHLNFFLPSPGNPNASLSDFKGKNVQVLTTDLSMVGDKKIDGATVAFGGPGYL